MSMGFQEVAEDQVQKSVLRAARDALAAVEWDLEIGPIRIRWFKLKSGVTWKLFDEDIAFMKLNAPPFDPKMRGLPVEVVEPQVIWLCARLKPASAMLVVAHEARHLWQHKNWDYTGPDFRKREEEDAERYMLIAPFDLDLEQRLAAAKELGFVW